MNNIDGLLKSQNLSRSNIIKTTIFLTDLQNFAAVNMAYQEFFATPFPARSTVEVSALPKGALVEIEVIAAK
jgi:2-iminobutanoate/2-iminopropanoate deaminase